MCKSNFNLFCSRYLFFVAIILLSISPLQNIYASAVPVAQEVSAKKEARQFKQKQKKQKLQKHHSQRKSKKHPTKTTEDDFTFWWILGVWYAVFLAMLIVGIVLGIAAVWITAVVFLCLPVLIFLVVLIVLWATIGFEGFPLCG